MKTRPVMPSDLATLRQELPDVLERLRGGGVQPPEVTEASTEVAEALDQFRVQLEAAVSGASVTSAAGGLRALREAFARYVAAPLTVVDPATRETAAAHLRQLNTDWNLQLDAQTPQARVSRAFRLADVASALSKLELRAFDEVERVFFGQLVDAARLEMREVRSLLDGVLAGGGEGLGPEAFGGTEAVEQASHRAQESVRELTRALQDMKPFFPSSGGVIGALF